MLLKVLQSILSYTIVYVIAFEDIMYVYGQVSQEMVDQGRTQYQLLQERGSLPKYGTCWKSAVEHVEEGCRNLSEDTQSDMALHITNCFLEMSGHETYNCYLDQKPNLRRICIRSMSDRAFNVYTEFYTHTQNICWFLRGQVWHETIADNTVRVGKQLESSAKNQATILKSQKESIEVQEKLMSYSRNLEKILEDFYISTKQHQEILSVMSTSLGSLQSWLVGELSWLDLIVFYVAAALLTCVFTSSYRTASARLPILFLLMLNAILERLICAALISNGEIDVHMVHNKIYYYIWWLRKAFLFFAVLTLIYVGCSYKDLGRLNHVLLQKIYDQNVGISENLARMRTTRINGDVSFVDQKTYEGYSSFSRNLNGSCKSNNYEETCEKSVVSYDAKNINSVRNTHQEKPKEKVPFNKLISGRQRLPSFALAEQANGRYNLRSRQGTPDSNI